MKENRNVKKIKDFLMKEYWDKGYTLSTIRRYLNQILEEWSRQDKEFEENWTLMISETDGKV